LFHCGPGGGGGGGGGHPGLDGTGGRGGGYSIAIYVQGGNATITNNVIVTSDGGKGGDGGPAGSGGSGGTGAPGGWFAGSNLQTGFGGGGGGPAIGILRAPGATAVQTGNTFDVGQGGAGGTSGGSLSSEDGEQGLRADVYDAPAGRF
jgi:hypothetical protein